MPSLGLAQKLVSLSTIQAKCHEVADRNGFCSSIVGHVIPCNVLFLNLSVLPVLSYIHGIIEEKVDLSAFFGAIGINIILLSTLIIHRKVRGHLTFHAINLLYKCLGVLLKKLLSHIFPASIFLRTKHYKYSNIFLNAILKHQK